jgi:hypothetical protein
MMPAVEEKIEKKREVRIDEETMKLTCRTTKKA